MAETPFFRPDIDWHAFVHRKEPGCRRQLWVDELGTSGDLSEVEVRCECGKSRGLIRAARMDLGEYRDAVQLTNGRPTENLLRLAQTPQDVAPLHDVGAAVELYGYSVPLYADSQIQQGATTAAKENDGIEFVSETTHKPDDADFVERFIRRHVRSTYLVGFRCFGGCRFEY